VHVVVGVAREHLPDLRRSESGPHAALQRAERLHELDSRGNARPGEAVDVRVVLGRSEVLIDLPERDGAGGDVDRGQADAVPRHDERRSFLCAAQAREEGNRLSGRERAERRDTDERDQERTQVNHGKPRKGWEGARHHVARATDCFRIVEQPWMYGWGYFKAVFRGSRPICATLTTSRMFLVSCVTP
jgi:hypothetical protein